MKLSNWAKLKGISYTTAYRMAKSGKLPNVEILPTGTIIVNEPEERSGNEHNVIYARVSSHNRRKELDAQVERITTFANMNGASIHKTYKEVASGMNDSRTQLWKMLDSNPTCIYIENKDRLTRFGFAYLQRLCKKLDIQIMVMNTDTDENDLMKDLVSVITSFCCRLYGMRRGYNKAKNIQAKINDND